MAEAREWRRDDWRISTDKRRLQVDVVHAFLASSYWAQGVPREIVERSIENSLCFGLYEGEGPSGTARERQVGFARVVTDFATFAWVGDVFVLESERGKGLATWLMEVIAGHPDLQGLRRWLLATRDAHGLYRNVGFEPLSAPVEYMERRIRASGGAAG